MKHMKHMNYIPVTFRIFGRERMSIENEQSSVTFPCSLLCIMAAENAVA